MSKRSKHRGHFCWCCGRIRPNEGFSGRGHARHLCRDCAKLGEAELAFRQAARNIDRLLDWNGLVRRNQRKSFERFLAHPEARVRAYAAEVAAHDAQERQAFRHEVLAEEECGKSRGTLCSGSVPDSRKHRGPHPRDVECFAPARLGDLRSAAFDLRWLLSRGYAEPSSLALVGNRYQLVERQRAAVSRGVARDDQLDGRARTRLDPTELQGRRLLVDGFNCCITLEVAASGGVVLCSLDGCFRDLASVHGSYRRVQETPCAIEWLLDALEGARPKSVHFFFDRPVSNSGKLAAAFREGLQERPLDAQVSVVDNADRALLEHNRGDEQSAVLSTDGEVLDAVSAWFDVAGFAVQRFLPQAWVVDLR